MLSLYTFVFTRLVDASSERSIEICNEVLELLCYEQETWSLLVTTLANENESASNISGVPEVGSSTVNPDSNGSTLPTAGRVSATG